MHTVRHLAAQRLGIALLFITLAWPGSDLPAQADAPIDLEIPAGRLATALNRLVDESGLQIVYDARLTEGLQSRRVSGRYTPEGALRELLADTDLDYRVRERGTVILERAAQASPPPEPLAQATPPPEPEEEVVTLPAITVTASPYDDTSYNVLDASTATKTDTPIMETPVSIQVVPRAVIEDQQAIRLEDALKNVSGVVTGFGFGGLEDTFIIRGFENSTNSWNVTEVYRDGALVVEGLFSLADVERVEVLKGPAAMLYGRLQPGGLINVVTKRPQSQAGYSLEQQFGSFDTYRTTLNATGPVTGDGSLAYRVDFEYLDQDSFRDFAFNEQVFVSPKLTWRISDRTQIDAEYVYFDQDSIVDGGLPVIGNRVANIPRERFLQEPTDRYSNEFQGGGLALTHSVTDNWKFQGKFFKYAATYATDSQVSPTSLDEATGILTRNVFDSEHVYDSIFGMANLTGKFSTWALDHTLLFGADYYDSGFDEDGVFLSAAGGMHQPPTAPAAAPLVLSEALTLKQAGGRNPTLAVDRRSGAVYLAWAQEVPGTAPKDKDGKKADPRLEVRVARSDDGGRSFGTPVVVNSPKDRVHSLTVSPTQVAVGPKGEVYVLYEHRDPKLKPADVEWGRNVLRLVRSEDGGKRYSAPVAIGTESVEGVRTSVGMLNLFAAPNGDLYASFLDYRIYLAYLIANGKEPPEDQEPPWQLRVARSTDGGRSFAKSTLVSKPVCGCCGTKVAQGVDGPLYATTRGQSKELKGSYDAVRDHFVAVSRDGGTSWSEPVKFHDDRFKISGCPDITPGFAVDSKGRLHAAWYTGTERHPGVFYARSDDEGKSFSKPIALLRDDWIPYGDVKLALDTRDNAWVAFEDRRGDEDLIQVARIAPDGKHTLTQAWPGTAPDVAAEVETAIVAWGTQGQGDEKAGGGINTRVISLP